MADGRPGGGVCLPLGPRRARKPLARSLGERGDFGEVDRLLQLLRRPYDDHGYLAAEAYAAPPPDWLQDTALT